MYINLKERKYYWFEDENGNKYDEILNENSHGVFTYHTDWSCQVSESIDEFCYHPKNWFMKLLCRNKKIFRFFNQRKDRTFKHLLTFNTTFGSKWAQECIVAMVNSGDFTLDDAIWVFTHSCERCMNVLLYKYLNGSDGYQEGSREWTRANTQCEFCKKPEYTSTWKLEKREEQK